MDNCVLLVTHGGMFISGPLPTYSSDRMEEVTVDPDYMSIFEIYKIVKILNYNPHYCVFYYLMPNMDSKNGTSIHIISLGGRGYIASRGNGV